MCENQAMMSHTRVSRRTGLCLELGGGCERSVFGLPVARAPQHRGPSVAGGEPEERQEPAGRINTP